MAGRIHVLAITFSAYGHVTPILHLTKRLASKGFKITMVVPTSYGKTVAQVQETSAFKIECLSDSSEEDLTGRSPMEHFRKLEAVYSENISKLMEKLTKSNQRPSVILYDSVLPWVLDVAHEYGLPGAAFFVLPCCFTYLHYLIFKGKIKINHEAKSIKFLPPLPPLENHDLPCFPTFGCYDQGIEKFYCDQFLNVDKAKWILFNTFDALESEVLSCMAKDFSIKTAGPTYLREEKVYRIDDHQLAGQSHSSIKWLDGREVSSVVYISFGTLVELKEEQMKEIAKGLAKSNCYFLWIVRSDEQKKIPANFKFEMSEKGLILEWCPQREVLAHPAVGCFLTHSGWNSTLESLSSGVPTIGMPYFVDQTIVAKFAADVWETGVRAKIDNKEIFTAEEIEMCIRKVTQSHRGKKLKQNAIKWKQEMEKATAPGGSSYRNIEDFASQLLKI